MQRTSRMSRAYAWEPLLFKYQWSDTGYCQRDQKLSPRKALRNRGEPFSPGLPGTKNILTPKRYDEHPRDLFI